MTPTTVPTLLIVDDEPGLRLALCANFLRHAWQVEMASGLREARTAFQRQDFDLVLCDMRMADGNGFEVLEEARSLAPNTAFLFLTAYGTVPEAVRAMQGGAVDYLTKPVSFDNLFRVAAKVLQERGRALQVAGEGATVEALSMDQVERTHLERTLHAVGGNRTRAAERLGISVRTMRNKIRQYDLPPRRYA